MSSSSCTDREQAVFLALLFFLVLSSDWREEVEATMQQLSQQKRHGRHGNHHRKEEMESVVTARGPAWGHSREIMSRWIGGFGSMMVRMMV